MKKQVRILVIGDPEVGKSSLIASLITESFPTRVLPVHPDVTIPPESSPDGVETIISDSSAKAEDRLQFEMLVRKADVICVVYDVGRKPTFNRIAQHWLPELRRVQGDQNSVPVVLVGNKIDIRGNNITNRTLENEIMPIMNEFKEVETCVECSAKEMLNISEVFFFAQKAVLHPTAPLYDARDHVLKKDCVSALKRIFKLCDLDKDGYMNDQELNEFQTKCFGAPLSSTELEGVKEVVRDHVADGVVPDRGLTMVGFLFLHQLFIQRGRLETTWTVLRKFGYDDQLSLPESFLCPPLKRQDDQAVELSSQGFQFFTELFKAFDQDQDGALSPSELDNLFSTAPRNPWLGTSHPIQQSSVTNAAGNVTLQGFLAQWALTTALDYRVTLRYLAYLGYPGEDRTKAVKVTKPRKSERRKGKSVRQTFQAYLFGAPGVGKSTVLDVLVNKKPGSSKHTTSHRVAVRDVEVDAQGKYLVVHEFGDAEEKTLANKAVMDAADVLVLCYAVDDVASFQRVTPIAEQFPGVPVVFVATKADLPAATWPSDAQTPEARCDELNLPHPCKVTYKGDSDTIPDLFSMLVGVGMNPDVSIPQIAGAASDAGSGTAKRVAIGAVVVTALAASSFFLYRYLSDRS